MQPHDFWQEIHSPKTFGPAESHTGFFPVELDDGRQIKLPIRPLPDGEHALASLIINQASFAVQDALAKALAEKLKAFRPEIIVGLPTLGLTLASAVAGGQGTTGAVGGVRLRQDAQGLGEEGRSERRKVHTAAVAHEQPRAQVLLELADVERQGRLGDVQALGRLAEMKLLGENDEVAEVSQFHGHGPLSERRRARHRVVRLDHTGKRLGHRASSFASLSAGKA